MEISDQDFLVTEDETSYDNASAQFSDPCAQPMATQWAAIRNLREEMEHHHRRFESLLCVSRDPTLRQLQESFQNSRAIRKTGVLILRDMLDGFCPSKLKDIFAFASLSYAVSQLLFKEGRIEKFQILEGLRAWRDAISDRVEREAFNKLARDLWPEARDHLHFIPLPRVHPQNEMPFDGNPPGLFQKTDTSSRTADEITTSMLDQWLTTSGPVGLSQAPMSWFEQAIDLTDLTHDTWNFSELSGPGGSLLNQPASTSTDFAGNQLPSSSHQPSSVPFDVVHEPTDLDRVQPVVADHTEIQGVKKTHLNDTCIFLVVVAFMADIQDLLRILSGSGLLSKPEKLYRAEAEEQRRFYKAVKEEFSEKSIHQDHDTRRRYNALLSVAKMFAREAYLRKSHEVKRYLVSISMV
jgi:hypothetical protein